MKNYQFFSKVYDEIMGAEYQAIYEGIIKKQLKSKVIKNKLVLELGCGTGTIIRNLSMSNKTFGIDISPEMIKVARKKDKKTIYKTMDMASFKLPCLFDIVFCAFDSINHISGLSKWQKVFQSSRDHLKEDGIFIFDFNTIEKFLTLNNKTLVRNSKNYYTIINTKATKNKCIWDISIFEKGKENNYKLYKERIVEYSFPVDDVLKELGKVFGNAKIIKQDKNRIFIVAKK